MSNEEKCLLRVDSLAVFYENTQALWSISFGVKEKDITAILGVNGAGKSTLINTIAGILSPKSGGISWRGEDITGYAPYQRVEYGISLVPERRRLFPYLTVLENLEIGAYSKRARQETRKTMEWVFQLFPILKSRIRQLAGTLSGGEQQMAAIARGLMSKPELLMLDEPSQGLAPLVVASVMNTLKELNEAGLTILIVEQNIRHALKIANKAFVLETGKIVMEGSSSELMNEDHIKKTYLGM